MAVVCVCLCANVFGQVGTSCQPSSLIVNVLDQHGIPLRGLNAQDFKVTYHGTTLRIASLSFSTGPRRVIVLLDTSGSMSGETSRDEWKIARAAVLDFVKSALPGTQLALVTFAADVQERTELSKDSQAITLWLNSNSGNERSDPRGPTALLESVLKALRKLQPIQPGDAIFAVTDGEDNSSRKESARRLKDALQGIRLFAFLLEDEFYGAVVDMRAEFFEMAKDSGGFTTGLKQARTGPFSHYVYDDRAEAIIKASAQIVNAQISDYYLLSLDPTAHRSTTEGLKVEAIDENGRVRKNVTVTYPHHLMPCASNQ